MSGVLCGQQRLTRGRYAASGLCTGSDRHLRWRREKARCAHRPGDAEGASFYLAVQNLLVRATAAGRRRMGSLYLGIVVCVVCTHTQYSVCNTSYFPRKVRPWCQVCRCRGKSPPWRRRLFCCFCAGLWAAGVGRPVALSHSSRIVKTLHLRRAENRAIVRPFSFSILIRIFILVSRRVRRVKPAFSSSSLRFDSPFLNGICCSR